MMYSDFCYSEINVYLIHTMSLLCLLIINWLWLYLCYVLCSNDSSERRHVFMVSDTDATNTHVYIYLCHFSHIIAVSMC